jgi:hypothetical protein
MTGTMLWAGKKLSDDEELRTRRLVAFLRRVGDDDVAVEFERFLPENDHRWTPDQLEVGAHVGPWIQMGDAGIDETGDELEADAA